MTKYFRFQCGVKGYCSHATRSDVVLT